MIFFGAVNDWEGGACSVGLIPFLIASAISWYGNWKAKTTFLLLRRHRNIEAVELTDADLIARFLR